MLVMTKISPESPLAAVQCLAYQNVPLVLTSTYKGLVLNQELKILELLQDRLVMQAPGNRICISLKGHTYLYSPLLPEVIIAEIDDINFEQGKIILSGLRFTGNAWKERYNERIQPHKPIYVDVQCRRYKFKADLDNLSMNGVKLIAYKLSEKGIVLENNCNVHLCFTLPGDQANLDLKGTIIYHREVSKLVKLGVRIYPNSVQAANMRLYIAARSAEILEELDQQCSELREQTSTPYLYF